MKKESETKIVLTGGHAATTALSVVEELVRRSSKTKKWKIYWVGTKRAVEGKKVSTLESEIFPKMGVNHHAIVAGRIQRKFTIWTLPSILRIPVSFIQSVILLTKIKPDVILSFGGFASFPVVVGGFLLRIPIVLHEQTKGVGRANKYSAAFAAKIALARKSSLNFLPKEKCVVTGNPVLTQIAEITPKKHIGTPPTIFVAGGSRGSWFLNRLVEQILEKLLRKYSVIHLTGPLDIKKYKSIQNALPKKLRSNYEAYSRIDPMQIDGVYKRADIIISRSGANTVSEIMIVKRPAILIPLLISSKTDQFANAKMAEKFGIAKVYSQDKITPEILLAEVDNIASNWNKIVKKVYRKKTTDILASQKVVNIVEEIVNEKK